MPNFILRNLPPDVWDAFRQRSQREGWPMRPLVIQLMQDYAAGRIRPSAAAPATPATGFMEFECGHGHKFTTAFEKRHVLERVQQAGEIMCPECGTAVALTEVDRATLEGWAHSKTDSRNA